MKDEEFYRKKAERERAAKEATDKAMAEAVRIIEQANQLLGEEE